jgi:hypothetical protein
MNFNDPITSRCSVLIVDRSREKALAALCGWLDGEANAAQVLSLAHRYIVVRTLDTLRNPRYLHGIECVEDFTNVLNAVSDANEIIEQSGHLWGLPSPCIVDIRTLLNDTDLARLDAWLAPRAEQFLRHAVAQGVA